MKMKNTLCKSRRKNQEDWRQCVWRIPSNLSGAVSINNQRRVIAEKHAVARHWFLPANNGRSDAPQLARLRLPSRIMMNKLQELLISGRCGQMNNP
jgi:cobalamin biosynthesis protein CobT